MRSAKNNDVVDPSVTRIRGDGPDQPCENEAK